MTVNFFVAIDFDGTVTDKDITDVVIQRFAKSGWEAAEERWEKGIIGSKECLSQQMSLIEAPISRLLDFVKDFAIDRTFPHFISFLKKCQIPHAIISDGFSMFANSILDKSGLKNIPVYANSLKEEDGRLRAIFPYSENGCASGTCKCKVAETLSSDVPLILIGDGRSDFCLADKAAFVFSKRKLSHYCKAGKIPHITFENFRQTERYLTTLMKQTSQYGMSRLSEIQLPLEIVKT